ncbi:MAG: hypothetical protein H6Q76_757 [Firmicutes bacterium]|nr:hypothetical protein [Bacillota bacterium]
MGRPTKNTADYFPHMTTHKKTMFIIEGRWGNDGYALWFKLLECMGNAPGHFYDCRKKDDWEYLYTYARISEETALDIINKLSEMGAIDSELWESYHVIWSDNFIEGLRPLYKRRQQMPPSKPSFGIRESSIGIRKPDHEEVSVYINSDTPLIPMTENDKVKRSEVKRSEDITTTTTITTNSPEEKPEEETGTRVVVVDLLTKNICMVSNQVEADMIGDWIETMPRDWIIEAIKQAALSKAKSIRYVDTILQAWVSKYKLDDKPWEVEANGRHRQNGLSGGHRRDPTPDEYERDRSTPGWGDGEGT